MAQEEYATATGPPQLLVVLSDGVDRVTEFCYVAATCGFAAVMLVGVFFRYVLNNSLTWSDEVATLLFAWATFFAVATAYLHDRHISIMILMDKLSATPRAIAQVLAEGIAGAFLLILLVSSYEAVDLVGRGRSDALEISRIYFFLPVPTAAALMLLHWVRRNFVADGIVSLLSKLLVMFSLFWLISRPFGQLLNLSDGFKTLLLSSAFVVPLILGVPVSFSLGLMASVYAAEQGTVPFMTGALQIADGVEIYALLAVPLLVLSGSLMHISGIAEHLVDFAQILVGRVRGGLGASNVVASFLFGDISGSSVSDTAAIGTIMIPEMKKHGYRADFCAALQGAAGTLGMTAPLSVTLILFATATEGSISRLAAATIFPAILVAISFVVVVLLHARRHNYARHEVNRSIYLARTLRALPGLFALVLIVGGILGGVFTPAEVGAILLFYVLLLAFLLYRRLTPRSFYRCTINAGHITGMTLFMTATSSFLGFMLARDSMGTRLVDVVSQLTENRYVVLFLVNVIFIILGMFLEAPAIIFGFMLSFLPLLAHVHIDPVHWGVLFVINMGLGMLVPPVALNLFISTTIAGVPYGTTVRAAVPFMLILVVDMVVIAVFPQIALFLPHLIFGYPMP
jgi:tripartite ATP-independent transporter DctM subunit